MDLSSPLRSIAPTLDSTVLEVLAGTEGTMGVTQIARLGGRGTRQGLSLALDRLVEEGLVIAQPGNRGHLYRFNRDHVLADAVLSATRARLTILGRITSKAEHLSPRPLHVSVFGSFARRKAGPESDIDVLVVLPDRCELDDHVYAQLRELGDDVFAWTGNRMEYLLFNVGGFGDAVVKGEDIVHSWVRDCITLLGYPIEHLVQAAHGERAQMGRS